ncbi:retrovirus-related Pol polyprotein from transposon 17.6 [Trichonephila clavipes]|uniref:RNA-directed DNA polymerase n=1 Tax=Trichonephila clavipes TaxID=2585209 RepID=A0A8X6T947_TRICX|nr:retrovirus-related Pol polyprotein from transposon 17.6 [Trichonephila clavipes]
MGCHWNTRRPPLLRIDGLLNISGVLQPMALPFIRTLRNPVFQQDNLRQHVDGSVRTFLDMKNVWLLPWPARSPDLSPIENAWSMFAKRLPAAMSPVTALVSSNGVRPDPDKIKAVRNFPTPKNIHDIRSFLGLCSYFRRFIKGFCYLAEPLQSLLKSGVEFDWGPEEVEAFNSLKKALTSDPVLGMYDERASTEIHTDASGYGIGAVLVQIQNNVEKVIAYASRTLTKAEKNYSTTERECLAIVWATNKFRPYIFGKHFTVVTDHHSLCWLMNLKDPSGRLARWALRLQEHDFDVKYKTGKKHSDADALSRNPVEEETETPDKFLAVTTSMNLAMEQKKDQDLAKLKLLSNSSKNEEFRFIDGILCRKNFDPDGKLWLPVIPKHLRADILRHFHDTPPQDTLVS